MSGFALTPEQSAAVENEGGALLVSAAAGSGKTRVLVERLLREVTENGRDVDDFLVITYTKAAAAELRSRVLDAVYARLAAEPDSRRLRRQAELCRRAQIGTIHSFCVRTIRENAHLLGLAPDVRVADETESGQLRREALDELLDECYEEGGEDFLALADTMGAGRDDSRLAEIVLDAYSKLMSHPYPEKWAEAQLKSYELAGVDDAAQTPWGRAVMERARRWADYWIGALDGILGGAAVHPDFLKAYGGSLETTVSGLREFSAALSGSWDGARAAAAAVEFPRAGGVPGYEDWKSARNRCKKELEKTAEPFCDDSEKALADLRAVGPGVEALLRLVLRFRDVYAARKRRRNVLDFQDQEHFALKLLTDEASGGPTEAAREISGRFAGILVDEYQDVNAIQELILGAVSRGGANVFMVGDVKQSIYRFRLADPTIFLRKYAAFPDAAEAAPGEGRKIVLSRNFRSRAGVLDAVNFVFRNVMSEEFGELDYTARESLLPGADYPENGEPAAELDVLDAASAGEDAPDKADAEAAFVAGRIRELVLGMQVSDGAGGLRPARWGDAAILLRSVSGKAQRYAAALNALGIPTALDAGADFFARPEIAVAVSLLTIADNPRQDVPLISALRSPVYGFTADELAGIRAACREGDFYTALVKRAETDEKCRGFLAELAALRSAAPDMTADEFLWYLYGRTGLFAVVGAMPGGERRRAGLMQLFDCARDFESTGYKGLFGFVAYLRGLMERGEAPVSDAPPKAENAVSIMSMHKSKGLEFPIVVLADLAKRFNTDDSKKPLLIHPELGVGPKRIDAVRRIEYPTLARRAVRERILSESMAEELRVLYVAMTRAREKLVLVASYADADKELEKLSGSPLPVPPQVLRGARSAADWLLMPALRRSDARALRDGAGCPPAEGEGAPWLIRLLPASGAEAAAPAGQAPEARTSADPALAEALREKLAWRYPHPEAPRIPSKVTATEIKGGFADAEASEDAQTIVRRAERPPRRPAFLEGRRALTAAERGVAAHLVMQYADYAKCLTPEGAAGEIARLKLLGTIAPEQADAVRPQVISRFFGSEAGRLVLAADRVRRELKFSLLVDSGELPGMTAGEKILLQGVVDCCAEKDGALTVIDFKTDSVDGEEAAERAERYRGQLDAYALAMRRMTGKPVSAKILYFLSAGCEVRL